MTSLPNWLDILSTGVLLGVSPHLVCLLRLCTQEGWWNRSGQSGFGRNTFWHPGPTTCECTYVRRVCTIVQQLFSFIMASSSSCSRNDHRFLMLTANHPRSSYDPRSSQIAASRMWCTKSSLSANSHILSMLRVRPSRKPQNSGQWSTKVL